MKYTFFGCLVIGLIIAAIDLVIFWGFQELWNWIVPIIWKTAPELTYWQAAGLVILLEIIGSFFKSSK